MNSKKEVIPIRNRKGTIYQKGTNEVFKISRSKFSNFIDCPRCFYLERVKGLKDPGMPGWALNTAVDELLKKEFDYYRKIQKPHPFVIENKLNFIPFQHEKIDYQRDAERQAELEKARAKQKKDFKFNFVKPRKDWSIYGGWVNAYEPVNKGRLGSTQEWKIEKLGRKYY